MSDAVSLFWSFGGLYFNYLYDIAVFGVSVLCYILGALLVSKILTMTVRVGRSISFRNRYK